MKAGKKLLRNNAGLGGSLETDRVMRAVMQFRNTLMQDCRRSPAPLTMKVVVKTMSRTRLGVTNTIEKHFTRVERGEGRHRDPSDELSASIQWMATFCLMTVDTLYQCLRKAGWDDRIQLVTFFKQQTEDINGKRLNCEAGNADRIIGHFVLQLLSCRVISQIVWYNAASSGIVEQFI